MAEAESQAVDFWSELEEAAEMVEGWEAWRQRYEADVSRREATPTEE